MNEKFYVSYEAARLLKEKGYRDKTMYGYSSEDQSMNTLDVREDYDWNYPDDEFHSTETGEYVEMFAAPTKAEAIDWLESKGIVVSVVYENLGIIGKKHYRSIINTLDKEGSESGSPIYLPSYDGDIRHYSTRLQAEEAAIIKALELLQ